MTTISTLPYISPQTLASHLLSPSPPNLAIIDVRDTDFIGGHIRSCTNVPVHTHDARMPELVRMLADKQLVVFHCALSQQRGPGSALRYIRERERMGQTGEQEVVVLRGGFSAWQQLYGEDERLTEGYRKDLWEFGY